MYTVAAHIMRRRSDAMNMITIDIPSEPMKKYLNNKRKEGKNISHLALILSAYVRTMSQFPELNRFVVNSNIYARNEIAVGMVVLKSGDSGHGTMSKIYFEPDDTVFDINDKINEYVEKNRREDSNNGTERIIKILLSAPGLLRFGVPFLMWLDKYGLLPKSIIDMSPFHMSLGISNLASIKTNHIYHHCYDFGTTGVFITMGNSREVPRTDKNGEIYLEKCMPLGVTMDERIASGSYFATAFRSFRKYLADPTVLEEKPEKVIPDPNVKFKKKKTAKR